MAAVAVAFDGQRLHDMGDTDGTTGITAIQGAAPGSEPDFFYQGSNAISKKTGTSQNGILVDTSAFGTPRSVDVTAADRGLWFIKMQATNFKALDVLGTPSGIVRAGSGSGDYYELEIISADDVFYPTVGGFNLQVWDPDNADYRDSTTGSPSMTAVDYFAFGCDFNATSRAENVILDAVDVGIGLTLVGGDGADADATWESFVSADEGTANNRWGCFSTKEGIIYVLGMHWIGSTDSGTTATATVFQDADNRKLVFPNSFFDVGDAGISLELGSATTDIDWTGTALIGRGTNARILFDTETDVVGGTTDEIQVQDMIDTFRPGEAVVARAQGGTETPGPTDGTTYYVGNDQTTTATGITLHTTKADAMNASGGLTSTPVNLTASTAGNGEKWRLDKKIDTKPTLFVEGTSGDFDMMGGELSNFCDITLTSVCTLDGVLVNTPRSITQGGARLVNCIFEDADLLPAEALIDCNDLADVDDNQFTSGGHGHALELSQTGTLTLTGNGFTGYHSTTDQTAHAFDNTTDVTGGATDTITLPTGHGYVTGSAIVYSKGLTANTVVGGLTDQTQYWVRNVTGNDFALYLNEGDALNDNNRISLTVGTGNEEHYLWPADAAIFNNSGGATTLTVSGGTTPSIRNALDTTTTVNANVTVTFDALKDNTEVRVYNNSTGAELDGIENATAGSPDNRNFGASVAAGTVVDYVIHNVQYEYIRVQAFTWPSTAQTLIIQQRFDRNFSNP